MLFLGDDSLAEGFSVIGFETYPNPEPSAVDRVFRDLLSARDQAFVIVDDAVMQMEVEHLKRVRREGGRIVVVAVPPLSAPPRLGSEVAERLASMFGGANLLQPTATKDST
ncbi:ATPase [Halochromatium salexigens]|uniref:ATPase n=2 Tax=Halochromatium salexigens TaxID=49447 RepID=A0AAJ0XFD4_HALSE|nr:V-type ATP synthase subunit F [Halochromatium salexigens]MBK5929595.1 ATPase [Halochromatium salexigens]